MPANRVEELERTVEELQSTVGGLTDELVEAKERIRVLEAELDTDAPTRVPKNRTKEKDVKTQTETTQTESVPTETAFDESEGADEEAEDSGTSDIIVA